MIDLTEVEVIVQKFDVKVDLSMYPDFVGDVQIWYI